MNAYIALGYACNHRCRFCPCGKSTERKTMQHISTDKFRDYIGKICKNKRINSITISGGEPTLQPNFIEILDVLSETHLNVGILTNSDFLSNAETLKRVVAHANPRQVVFTTALHSYLPAEHDAITQVEGSFVRSTSVLQSLAKIGYKVTIKHIIHKKSYKKLEAYIKTMMKEFPSNNVSFLFCGMDYCGMDIHDKDEFSVSFRDIAPYLEQTLKFFEDCNNNVHMLKITDIPLCTVDPYYWKYFNYSQKSSLSAYASPIASKTKTSKITFQVESDCNTFFLQCKQCDVREICPGAWRSSYKLFGENAVKAIKCNYS